MNYTYIASWPCFLADITLVSRFYDTTAFRQPISSSGKYRFLFALVYLQCGREVSACLNLCFSATVPDLYTHKWVRKLKIKGLHTHSSKLPGLEILTVESAFQLSFKPTLLELFQKMSEIILAKSAYFAGSSVWLVLIQNARIRWSYFLLTCPSLKFFITDSAPDQ